MDFKIENLLYLYNTEYRDGWTHRPSGYFIDPYGIKYRYKETNDWKSYRDWKKSNKRNGLKIEDEVREQTSVVAETEIKPQVLFHNLNLCKIRKPLSFWFNKQKGELQQEIVEDLLNSVMVFTSNEERSDASETTNSLFIYDDNTGFYRQILLSCNGYCDMQNDSVYSEQLISHFGVYRYRFW